MKVGDFLWNDVCKEVSSFRDMLLVFEKCGGKDRTASIERSLKSPILKVLSVTTLFTRLLLSSLK